LWLLLAATRCTVSDSSSSGNTARGRAVVAISPH
jgi:hypothetical protein